MLADGAATEVGQLALGSNVTVAFMPWYGHNFEDAIVLSERLVKDDVYSSIHIQELELHVRDTKRGQEEITREIPNVSEEALLDLDERGIVRIGAHVKPGDILVGKITPKGETELSPEEKLLTAIFGEKAKDVKDSSLKVPPGMEGVVIDVKIFSRIEDQVVEKDRGERIGEVRRLEGDEKIRVNEVRDAELVELLDGQVIALALKSGTVEEAIPAGTKVTADSLRDMKLASIDLKTFRVENKRVNERIRQIIDASNDEKAKIEEKAEERIDRILQPDELPPGVIQLVKVYLAEKRKVSVGDKMAGRHGNKGIVARVVPEEDMPFLPDGRPVDIVLNPLGVPCRMNVGQILETHLGWVAKILGFYAKTPVFQGANEREIGLLLKMSGVLWAGQALELRTPVPKITDAEILRSARRHQAGPREGRRAVRAARGGHDQRSRRPRRCRRRRATSITAIRDFLASAAKELAEREHDGDRQPDHVPHGWVDDETQTASKRTEYKAALKQLEKRRAIEPADRVERSGAAGARRHARQEVRSGRRCGGGGAACASPASRRSARCGCATAAAARRSSSPVTVGEIYMLKLIAPGRRQDPRAEHRTVLARHAAAARR